MTTTTNTTKFQTGNRYSFRWIGDSNMISVFEIVRRTEKSVWAVEIAVNAGPARRFKISNYEGEEFIRPYGVYSMSPTLRAGNKVMR